MKREEQKFVFIFIEWKIKIGFREAAVNERVSA
jgi:hypothetical protein